MRAIATAGLLMLMTIRGVHAMLAADFLDKFTGDQSAAYLDGAVEMHAYALAKAGQSDKATCLRNWFYRGQGPAQGVSTIRAHRDLPVEGLLTAIFGKVCQ